MANIRIEVLNKCEQIGRRWLVNVYSIYIRKGLPSKLYEEICGLFYNKVIQDCRYYSYNENLEEVPYDFIEPQAKWGLEISFLPGMTDNVGNTVKQIVREYLINKDYIDENVCIKARSSKLILSQATEDDIKQEFNPITEYCILVYKENGNCYWRHYGKLKGVIPVPRHWDPENFKQLYNENWIPVSSTGMTEGETGMTEGRAGDTHYGVIPARDQEKKEWIPVSSTGMTFFFAVATL